MAKNEADTSTRILMLTATALTATGCSAGTVLNSGNGLPGPERGAAPVEYRTASVYDTNEYAEDGSTVSYGNTARRREDFEREYASTVRDLPGAGSSEYHRQQYELRQQTPDVDPFSEDAFELAGSAYAPARQQSASVVIDPSRGEAVPVLPGDTLFRLSERHRVALRALIDVNNLEPPFAVSVGETLYLPPPNVHVVEPGETIYAISRRYNVDTRSLANMNQLPKPWTIYPGDKVVLPALARDTLGGVEVVQTKGHVETAGSGRFDHTSASAAKPNLRPIEYAQELDGFIWPLQGHVLASYGPLASGRRNDGLNISATHGAPFVAVAGGQVVYASDELPGFGNMVLVSHNEGWVSAYAHADSLDVKEGDIVRQGQTLGRVGETGSVGTPQLHFQLRQGKSPVDPNLHLKDVRGA